MAQSNADFAHFSWEWPADRKPQIRVLIKVNKLEKQEEGFLGAKKSPSITANLPDAMVLEGTIVTSDTGIAEQSIVLRFPNAEIPEITLGDKVALGLINDDICICAEKLPASIGTLQEAEWLSNWNCIK